MLLGRAGDVRQAGSALCHTGCHRGGGLIGEAGGDIDVHRAAVSIAASAGAREGATRESIERGGIPHGAGARAGSGRTGHGILLLAIGDTLLRRS